MEIRRNVPQRHAAKSEYYAENRNEHFKELTKHTTTTPGRSTCNSNWTEVYLSEESYWIHLNFAFSYHCKTINTLFASLGGWRSELENWIMWTRLLVKNQTTERMPWICSHAKKSVCCMEFLQKSLQQHQTQGSEIFYLLSPVVLQ